MSFKAETKVTPPTVTQRSGKYVAYIVIFMGLIALLDQYLNLLETAIVGDIILEFWGVVNANSIAQFQLWQGIFGAIGFSVFFISWLSDAWGRKKGLLVLILVMGVPAMIVPFTPFGAPGLPMFMILYGIIIMGTLSNVWEIPVTEESPPEKRGMFGSLAFLIGLIPLYAILAPMIARTIGWKWAYGIMGILMAVCLILLYFMKETERWECCKEERKHAAHDFISQVKTLNRKDVIYLAVFTGVYIAWNMAFKMGGIGGNLFYVGLGMEQEFNLILTVAGLMTMVGAILSAVLMDKVGRNGTMVIGASGSVISYILLPFTGAITPLALWMAYMFMPIVLAWIMVYFAEMIATKNRATSVGILSSTSRVGYVVGPLLGSLLMLTTGSWHVYFIVAGLLMIVPLMVLFMKPYEAKSKTLEEIQEER